MPSSRLRPVSLVAVAALALFGLSAAAPGAASASSQSASAPGTPSAAHPAPPAPKPAAPQFITTPHFPVLPAGVRQVCARPSHPGQMTCDALARTNMKGHAGIVPNVNQYGYSPTDLQNAYNLTSAASSAATSGETVAVVDAYDDPNAALDLKTYRAQYGLPACSSPTGVGTGAGCITVVNQNGAAGPLPGTDPTGGWEVEESTDLDMVSAICPQCHILLVEAISPSLSDLGTAENSAATAASFVSNSWGSSGEFTGESAFDSAYFDHPGKAVTFAAGDFGYGVQYPAASQFVTSVGGTTLNQASSTTRGWTETAWNGTGSGCAAGEAKPSWQAASDGSRGSGAWDPNGCLNRTDNDVAAVADPNTPVAIYDTYPVTGSGAPTPGWNGVGGTSVAAPIIASVYALAGNPTPNTYPSSYLYRANQGLYDVTSGTNGTCESNRPYLCHGGTGYDGPTGLGTPNGAGAFKNAATTNIVSVKNPGAQDFVPGMSVNLPIQALDSTTSQTLAYSATGLPSGLSINASSGVISGTVANPPGTHTVQVTATDTSNVTGTVKFNIVVMPNLDTAYTAGSGPVRLALGGKCLDDANNSSANGNKIQIWNCTGGAAQNWKFRPDGTPGNAGTLNIQGKCADVTNRSTTSGAQIQLWSCNGGASQQWLIAGGGFLVNPVSNLCLDDPGTANGTRVDISTCTADPNTGTAAAYQNWTLPASEVTSGVAGKCLDDANNSSANGNKVQIWNCTGGASQKWVYASDGTIRINGKCLDMANASTLDGAKLQLWTCLRTSGFPKANQLWFPGPGLGELVNANSSRCLADPGDNTGNGTPVTQEDCYGRAGEVWQVS